MNTFIKGLGTKKSLCLSVGVIALLGLGIFNSQTASSVQSLSNLSDGMRVCFGRVQQSFMARMLNDTNSQYLNPDFMQNTERCFGEASSLLASKFADDLKNAGTRLNDLATDTHWFHEKISPDGDSFTQSAAGVVISNTGGRFAKLEIGHHFILDELQKHSEVLSQRLSRTNLATKFIAALLFIFFLAELLERRSKRNQASKIDNEARDLMKKENISSMRVQEVIKSALELQDLSHCSELFRNFHFYKMKIGTEDVYKSYAPIKTDALSSEETIDQIWADSDHDDSHIVVYDEMFQQKSQQILEQYNSVPKGLSVFSLDEVSSSVIDHFSSKIFTQGVQLSIKVDEGHLIYASDEALEQVLYQSINLVLKSKVKSLNLRSRQLGQAVVFDIEAYGDGFDQKIIKNQLVPERIQEDLPLELVICRELCGDIDAKLGYDNLYNEEGSVSGRFIRLTFKKAKQEKTIEPPKRVHVSKGTKREILEKIQTSL